ncbi:phosphoethanolamine transferase [Gemmobacter serpentinus]|uniref:phosphoethanolamine transferase n=1 Tax=Gemmobacter serpentinus TaxID=2652247 RepID=UPI001CF66FFE|nr:phosphoethanolamine--lipid A transferase [Gemmobacter serpentinus]
MRPAFLFPRRDDADGAASFRPELTPLALNLIVAAWLLVLMNGSFWGRVGNAFAGSPMDQVLFGGAAVALMLLVLSLITLPLLHRPLLALMIVTAAVADFYQRSFGVLIDKEMIRNAMLTTTAESKHLITGGFVLHLLFYGILPAALVFWPRLHPAPWHHRLWRYPLGVMLSAALMAGFLAVDFKSIASAVRMHRDMMASFQPGATLSSLIRYAKDQTVSANQPLAALGTDAKPGPALAAAKKPVLMVIFVGETVRAQNFGLNGYARDTTPELRKMDVLNFPDVSSCGTSTAVSLPCMFSPYPADDYSHRKFMGSENLLDVLDHAGLQVEWVDNNTGDQRIATRVTSRRIAVTEDAVACASGECTDAALLPVLARTMEKMTEDTVLVLHMIGSHGPAYSLRYPPEFEAFTPACQVSDFSACTNDEIVNAYDNSVRFTDHILASAIAMMGAQDRVIPAMIYLSDHGESLGEGGLYLHAAPMFMAPETQRKVPFVMWLSPPFKQVMGLDQACLARKGMDSLSQDYLFHSVLGLMDVQTSVRQPALDLTQGCRAELRASG